MTGRAAFLLPTPNTTMQVDRIIPKQYIKIVNATGTPVPLGDPTRSMPFRRAYVIGNKAPRTANTGSIFIGCTPENDTQPITVTTGSILNLEAPVGQEWDLKDWWIDAATAGDGAVVIFS